MEDTLQSLTKQISILYSSPKLEPYYLEYFTHKAKNTKLDENTPEVVKTVEKACNELGIRTISRFYKVESDYYEWELQRRAFRLVAPSIDHLCKSVIFENTRCIHDNIDDPLNSKYYCVIVQYIGSINTQKLMNFVRGLKNKSISKKNYNFRVADAEKSIELTGFENNGVSPIGMNKKIPIIISKSITELKPPIFYIGGGHIDWKLALPIKNFINATKCLIADLT
ncbi:6726_t:CDS:2 [Scutellospora calospora]|uniref:6726_t:CDS:1 n=1 Tax=Scutellospora calospora TaxID=85575 RepID=A0ACA9LTT2_9GLOM|nr:6726_t:CDS:2 [Scutellospora calospora]